MPGRKEENGQDKMIPLPPYDRGISIGPTLYAEKIQPGRQLETDDDVLAFMRERAVSTLYSTGTCRIGPNASTFIVVPHLKLHGIHGLRIVDGNSHGVMVMIAEKAAEMIIADSG